MKKKFLYSVYFFLSFLLVAQSEPLFSQLKSGFLSHDVELQKLQLAYEKALLEYAQTKVQEGLDVAFQTGGMKIVKEENGTQFSLSPSIKFSLPFVQNSAITFSVPMEIAKNNLLYDRAGVFFSFDIFSSTQKERIISLNKAERSVLEAERAIIARKKVAEKEFLSLIKNLYEQQETIFSFFDDYYEQEQTMETLKIQGYIPTSARYRTQELNLKKYSWEIEKAENDFRLSLEEFSRKCGVSLESLDFIIPTEKIEIFSNYTLENFIDYEKTVWNYGINKLTREAKKDFSLGFSGGYAYTKDSTKEKNALATEIGGSYKGLDFSTGVDIPLDGTMPEYSLSFGINWGEFKKNTLEKKDAQLSEQLDLVNMAQAKTNFSDFMQDKELEAKNLLWVGKNYQEQLSLYEDLYKESEKWFAQGIISEKEMRQAKTNYYQAQNKVKLHQVDILLFNLSFKEKFLDSKEK